MDKLFSADSHVVESEECYAEIDPSYRDLRPRSVDDPEQGAQLVVPGMDFIVPASMLSRAGVPYAEWSRPQSWSELHPAALDSKARLAIQDEEGVLGEVIYPSAGMVICMHPDPAYKKAVFEAYNRWLQQFCAIDPDRLIGVAQAAIPTVEEGLRELEQIKEMGFRSVMLCGDPAFDDYDQPSYAPIWDAIVDLDLIASFHILTGKDSYGMAVRGPQTIQQIVTMRGNQNIIMMMVLGGVFDRHPRLRTVMVENDAGWLPHFAFRLDHNWERYRWTDDGAAKRPPSEYIAENIYVTFQDDSSVRYLKGGLNFDRVMWATDFPHGDGTYPRSREIATQVTEGLEAEQRTGILYDNAAALYGL